MAALVLTIAVLVCTPARADILNKRSNEYKWRLCPATLLVPLAPHYTVADTPPDDTEVRADSVRLMKDGVSQFSGDVEIIRGMQALSADLVTYDSLHDSFAAEGRTRVWDNSMIWSGAEALYDMNSRVSDLDDGDFWIMDGRGRGHAGHLRHERDGKVTVLQDVQYSTCPMTDEAWRVSASTIKLDHESERGSATNAVLRVRDVPVFWFPYVNFPISDKRKSGFLSPTFGNTNQSGFEMQLPYYWNIAPNQDATLTPRVLTDRGAMLAGQYRYMNYNYEGDLDVEYLPSDSKDEDRDRSLIAFNHTHYMFDRHGRFRVVVNNVSDDQYFEDFGSNITATSQRFLDRRIDFNYFQRNYRVTGLVQAYQTIDNTLAPGSGPYRRLPQVNFFGRMPKRVFGLRPELRADTTYFDRDESVSGGRVDFEPALSLPIIRSYLDIQPRIALRQSEYYLDDPNGVFGDRVSRTVPIFSVDSSVFFERRMALFGNDHIQTFEPRVFYLLIPKVGQDDIPRFDSGEFNVSFSNLFRDNRFTGQDRIGDANQVTTAVTSRMLDVQTGRETYRFSVGQIYYFRDREVVLPGRSQRNDGVSELISEAATSLTADWSARGVIQWDPNESKTELAAATLRYRPDLDTVVNLSYRFRRALSDIEQTDLSLRWPLTDSLAVIGRWNYSLHEHRALESLAGIEFESCCWGVRLVGRRFLRNAEGAFDTGMFLQVEFRGLGGVGKKSGSILTRGIPGYEDPFE